MAASGTICVGPEFYPDPSTGKLRVAGVGTKAWPTISGAQSVYGGNNGLMYDPQGGLYTAPHGQYRWWQRWTGLNLLTPIVPGVAWVNTALSGIMVTNPSLVAPLALQWWATLSAGVTVTPGNSVVHQVGTTASPTPNLTSVGSIINPQGSGAGTVNAYVMPWIDTRESFSWTTLAPGMSALIAPCQQVLCTASGTPSATATAMDTYRVELLVQGMLIDANQVGGYV